jgi:hypothetical protein
VKENKYFKKDNYYTMHFRHLKNLTAEEYLEKRLAETSIPRPMDNNRHSLRVNFSVDQTHHNINFTLFPLSPSFPERVRRDSISISKDNLKLRSESQCSALETVSKIKKSKAKFGLLDNYLPASRYFESTPLPDVSFTHEKAYQNWAEQFTGKYKYIHESMKKFMMRSNETVEEGVVFTRRFDEECNKTFLSLHMFDGKVEVTPLQAQNLPDSRNAVFVRISYGEEVIKTTNYVKIKYSISFLKNFLLYFICRNLIRSACLRPPFCLGTKKAWTIISPTMHLTLRAGRVNKSSLRLVLVQRILFKSMP